ncbi:hypothetical protein JCM6882_008002 [Rhodosporidiobolus microsporus]
MRISTAVAAVALSAAVPVHSAPIFGLGSIVSNILHTAENKLETYIDSWNEAVQESTDSWKHGKVVIFDPLKFIKALSSKRYSHQVTWPRKKKFPGWRNYKANGVNLGTWLEIETNYAPSAIPAAYSEEWSYCEDVGKDVCGPVLEKHYDSWVTRDHIDTLAKYGVNTLRIPTTYASWYDVPGSQLYHGNQVVKLKNVAEYAIKKYNMHVIIGLHSLPGGVNWLQIGEAQGHLDWWYNATNFDYSLKVVDKVLDYIEDSYNPTQYTFEAINEPCDDFSKFATPETVSANGTDWLNTYMRTVYSMIEKRGLSTCYWTPFWSEKDRFVIDSHFCTYMFFSGVYTTQTDPYPPPADFFAASGVYATYTSQIACGQAEAAAIDFPVFVGEWSLQSYYNNTLALRQEIFQTQQYAWQKYLAGGAFWNIRYEGTDLVSSGEGGTKDYWSFMNLINDGVTLPGGAINGSYC